MSLRLILLTDLIFSSISKNIFCVILWDPHIYLLFYLFYEYEKGNNIGFVSLCYFCDREPKEENPSMECNGEDDSKGIRKRKAKVPLKEESRDNGEKKENPDEIVSMHHKPIPASIWVGVLPCVAILVAP